MTDMSLFDTLHKDHEKVSNLISSAMETDDEDDKIALSQRIALEIEMHSKAEEETVYPMLKKQSEAKQVEMESEHEHEEIRDRLQELLAIGEPDGKWDESLQGLKEAVDHHVAEEESVVFDKLRELFTEDELERVRDAFLEAKMQFDQAV